MRVFISFLAILGAASAQTLWTNGVVPYEIAPNTYSSSDVALIHKTVMHINSVSCVKFVNRTDPNVGCGALGGMQGGLQTIAITPPGCSRQSTITHELFHILGIGHEQNRLDRDNYITIDWSNIKAGDYGWLDKLNSHNTITPYDYQSNMHYEAYTNAVNGSRPVLIPKVAGQKLGSGPHIIMSPGDISRLNKLYGCPPPKPYCPARVNPGDNCENFSRNYGIYSSDRLREMNPGLLPGQCELAVGDLLYVRYGQGCGTPCTPSLC